MFTILHAKADAPLGVMSFKAFDKTLQEHDLGREMGGDK
jgi:hypothetical protein